MIVSLDTLAGQRMFGRLGDAHTEPYDLVVFDEAHKLSAARLPDFRVRKTGRYRLAEAIAGVDVDDERWTLPWSATTCCCSRRLLTWQGLSLLCSVAPSASDTLQTLDAFAGFPSESRRKHFVRRTKEEMVYFDGTPLYPQRNCDTLSTSSRRVRAANRTSTTRRPTTFGATTTVPRS